MGGVGGNQINIFVHMTDLHLFWLDINEVCLCSLPATFSLPTVNQAFIKRASSITSRTLIAIGSRGVIDGRLFLTSKCAAFFANPTIRAETSTFLLKIPYTEIPSYFEKFSADKSSSSILLSFASSTYVPLKQWKGKWRNAENHKHLVHDSTSVNTITNDSTPPSSGPPSSSDENPSALIRMGDSNIFTRLNAIELMKTLIDSKGAADALKEVQEQALDKLLKSKHIMSQNVLKNIAPPLYCYVQEILCRRLAAIAVVPNGGFALIELPSGRNINYSFTRCVFAFERLIEMEVKGVELFYSISSHTGVDTSSTLLIFQTEADQKKFVQHLESADNKLFAPQRDPSFLKHITDIWQQGRLSNFHYLQFLNCLGGRSHHLINRYPVYPWVTSNYDLFLTSYVESSVNAKKEASKVDIEKPAAAKNPTNFRDLSKPVGALSHDRLESLLERMSWLARKDQYLYGSHYSTPDFVAHWHLRDLPELHLKLNHGKMDHLSRLFRSITDSWDAALKGQTSFMELIPEFYQSDPAFLLSTLPIVHVSADSQEQSLDKVALPHTSRCPFPEDWFRDKQKVAAAAGIGTRVSETALTRDDIESMWYLFMHRCLLEGDLVSRRLHKWIDLIFGHRQRGEAAEESFNVFHPITYVSSLLAASADLKNTLLPTPPAKSDASATKLRNLDPSMLKQMEEFGQAPFQIFTQAHPARRAHLSALLMSSHTSRNISVEGLFSQFLMFISSACKSPVSQVLSSISWVALLQRCPKLLPLPNITRRLESTARCVDTTEKSHLLSRLSQSGSTDDAKSIITWTGLSSCKVLDRRLVCETPSKSILACHSNRLAVLSESGSLSIYSLNALVAEAQVDKVATLRRADHRLLCPVGPIMFSSTGSHLICGAPSGCPYLINVAESIAPAKTATCWSGHKGAITCLAVNVNSHRQVITGGTDESIALWDIDCGKVVSWWEGHSGSILSCWQQDQYLVSSACDSTVVMRDTRAPGWTAPIWTMKFDSNMVCTDLAAGSRYVQCVLRLRKETPALTQKSPCTDLLWRRLESLSGVPTAPSRRNAAVSAPAYVVSADWRMAPPAVEALAFNGAPKELRVAEEKVTSARIDPGKDGRRITAVRAEGENSVLIGGCEPDNTAFITLCDATTFQELGKWPLGVRHPAPERLIGFPHRSACFVADPLQPPTSLCAPSWSCRQHDEPVPFMIVQSEQNRLDIFV
eukprot:Blabericola_migrator_1__11672@NODE_703_length_6798_cov_75_067301_g511_i0_p1_GENE_NODE_703_length_6798_cov_75_067301_g511_i0NODE_703_length_6798_cov_75_067301_g511_i0_p1_ORF_typecomplete_len1211_score162_21Beach/PF02138_18/1e74ANAPC4_WD40/PF12894_7/1e06ANAPC4_WD40/PF12894_7/0_058ANAPC4_WD40/PF12894_7/1_9e03WD40/PF00400_32/1_5e03WD40/PF00400_32/0_0011WD40/PF00400_32/2_8WD40_like/PF17005_5/6_1e02WD40_like/PF17005_5/0_00044_NODE_703_length_6798_cov_75_067301_g511_i0243656